MSQPQKPLWSRPSFLNGLGAVMGVIWFYLEWKDGNYFLSFTASILVGLTIFNLIQARRQDIR